LHCFSDGERHTSGDLTRLVADIQALTGKAERAITDEALALQLHSFSPPESHTPGQGP
jgi:hypothetical protein